MDSYSNYDKQCKDTQGGFKKAYLLPYVEYNEAQVKNSGLELTTFPYSRVYEFEITGSFTQQSTLDKGNVSFSHSVTGQMPKIYNFYDVNAFVRNDFRVIVLDNNGNLVIFGVNNGMTCSISNTSGSSKSEFNGFGLTFEGKEELTGLYIDDFDSFFYTGTADGSVFNYDLNFDII